MPFQKSTTFKALSINFVTKNSIFQRIEKFLRFRSRISISSAVEDAKDQSLTEDSSNK